MAGYIISFLLPALLVILVGRDWIWKKNGKKDMSWWQAVLLFLAAFSAAGLGTYIFSLTPYG